MHYDQDFLIYSAKINALFDKHIRKLKYHVFDWFNAPYILLLTPKTISTRMANIYLCFGYTAEQIIQIIKSNDVQDDLLTSAIPLTMTTQKKEGLSFSIKVLKDFFATHGCDYPLAQKYYQHNTTCNTICTQATSCYNGFCENCIYATANKISRHICPVEWKNHYKDHRPEEKKHLYEVRLISPEDACDLWVMMSYKYNDVFATKMIDRAFLHMISSHQDDFMECDAKKCLQNNIISYLPEINSTADILNMFVNRIHYQELIHWQGRPEGLFLQLIHGMANQVQGKAL